MDQRPLQPGLPASIWGTILSFSWLRDARSATLTGRLLGREAVRYVNTLSIGAEAELDIGVARKFPNVTRVNVLCLFRNERGEEDDEDPVTDGSSRAVGSVVPFLSAFSRLEEAFIGGLANEAFRTGTGVNTDLKPAPLCDDAWDSAENPTEGMFLNRALIISLCGAFRSRALSNQIKLRGVAVYPWISKSYTCNCDCRKPKRATILMSIMGRDVIEATCPSCLCEEVCEVFPLDIAFGLNACMKEEKQLEIILGRPDGRKYLASVQPLAYLLGQNEQYCLVRKNDGKRETFVDFGLCDSFDYSFDRLTRHLDSGFGIDPTQVSKAAFIAAIFRVTGCTVNEPIIVPDDQLESLRNMGFGAVVQDILSLSSRKSEILRGSYEVYLSDALSAHYYGSTTCCKLDLSLVPFI